MASDTHIAKLLAHIAACQTAILPGRRLPLYAGNDHFGFLEPDFAAKLAGLTPLVSVAGPTAHLAPEALPKLNDIACDAGIPFRGEDFDVRVSADAPVLTVLDRGALPSFGVIGVGAHLNGLVRRPDGWHVWVATRAAHKKLDPGKLDHLVAGGVSAGMTPFETLIKEAEEEASLPASIAQNATLTGRFAYNMEREEGLRRDVIFAYDLELPEDFTPKAADGEVESFALWPLEQILEILATSDDFKFNVALVLIDLCIRKGLITGTPSVSLRTALEA